MWHACCAYCAPFSPNGTYSQQPTVVPFCIRAHPKCIPQKIGPSVGASSHFYASLFQIGSLAPRLQGMSRLAAGLVVGVAGSPTADGPSIANETTEPLASEGPGRLAWQCVLRRVPMTCACAWRLRGRRGRARRRPPARRSRRPSWPWRSSWPWASSRNKCVKIYTMVYGARASSSHFRVLTSANSIHVKCPRTCAFVAHDNYRDARPPFAHTQGAWVCKVGGLGLSAGPQTSACAHSGYVGVQIRRFRQVGRRRSSFARGAR